MSFIACTAWGVTKRDCRLRAATKSAAYMVSPAASREVEEAIKNFHTSRASSYCSGWTFNSRTNW